LGSGQAWAFGEVVLQLINYASHGVGGHRRVERAVGTSQSHANRICLRSDSGCGINDLFEYIVHGLRIQQRSGQRRKLQTQWPKREPVIARRRRSSPLGIAGIGDKPLPVQNPILLTHEPKLLTKLFVLHVKIILFMPPIHHANSPHQRNPKAPRHSRGRGTHRVRRPLHAAIFEDTYRAVEAKTLHMRFVK
jgi:hypothetical protein